MPRSPAAFSPAAFSLTAATLAACLVIAPAARAETAVPVPPPASAFDGTHDGTPDVRIVEHGEYVVDRDLGQADPPPPGAEGVTGLSTVEGPRFLRSTTRIPLQRCRRFGIRFDAPNVPPGTSVHVTVRLTHPRLERPDGISGEVDSWPTDIDGDVRFAGFHFDHAWEMVPGPWTFALLVNGRVAAEQRFKVVPPGDDTPPPLDCAAPVS